MENPFKGSSGIGAHEFGLRGFVGTGGCIVCASIFLALFFPVSAAMGARVIEAAKFSNNQREYKVEVVSYEQHVDGKNHQDVILKDGLFQIWKFSDYMSAAIPEGMTFKVYGDSNNGIFAVVQQWAGATEVYYFRLEGTSVTRYLNGSPAAPSASRQTPASRPSQSAVDTIAPRDAVTGRRTLNLESERDEIARANSQTAERIAAARQAGIAVNADTTTLARLKDILVRIARVSHRANLPWEIFLFEDKEVKASTIGGGKIFVYRGLFGELVSPQDMNELAAVIAHEAAHVTCKHVGEKSSMQIASRFEKDLRGKMYTASYTTLQEDEADRVGLLYMALAGYNPDAAAAVWARAHGKYGSAPGDYAYDHSLNIERMNKIKSLLPIARKYYRGQGVVNSDYERILVKNDLIERSKSVAGDNEVLKAAEGVSGTLVDIFRAKTEETQRKGKRAADSMTVTQSIQIVHSNIGIAPDGLPVVLGKIQNVGNRVVRDVELQIQYHDMTGRVIFSDPLSLGNINLGPYSLYDFGTYIKNVPGWQNITVVVSNGTFAQ